MLYSLAVGHRDITEQKIGWILFQSLKLVEHAEPIEEPVRGLPNGPRRPTPPTIVRNEIPTGAIREVVPAFPRRPDVRHAFVTRLDVSKNIVQWRHLGRGWGARRFLVGL